MSLSRLSLSPSILHGRFLERGFLAASLQMPRARGLHFTGVYARGLKPRVSRGLHDNVIVSGKERQVRRLKTSPLPPPLHPHIYYSAFPRTPPFSPLFFSPHSIISVTVLNLFIAQLTLLRHILLTARAAATSEGSFYVPPPLSPSQTLSISMAPSQNDTFSLVNDDV